MKQAKNNLILIPKLYHIECHESYYILAENEEQAKDYFENSGECINEDLKQEILNDYNMDKFSECYDIEEIEEDTTHEIAIVEDSDLANITNRFKNESDNGINVYLFAKYYVLTQQIYGQELELPVYIAGSE